jgi:AcrR family transcriptional regulator
MALRSDAAVNQRKIVEAAKRVMATEGLQAELTTIAEAAGVGVGTVYRCVGNRDQVLSTIVREAFAEMASAFNHAEAESEPGLALSGLLRSLYTTVQSYGWLNTAVVEGRLREELREELRSLDFATRFQALYGKAFQSGLVRPDVAPNVAAALILGSLTPWSIDLLRAPDVAAAAESVLSIFRIEATR